MKPVQCYTSFLGTERQSRDIKLPGDVIICNLKYFQLHLKQQQYCQLRHVWKFIRSTFSRIASRCLAPSYLWVNIATILMNDHSHNHICFIFLPLFTFRLTNVICTESRNLKLCERKTCKAIKDKTTWWFCSAVRRSIVAEWNRKIRHFQFLKYQGRADINLWILEAQNENTERTKRCRSASRCMGEPDWFHASMLLQNNRRNGAK